MRASLASLLLLLGACGGDDGDFPECQPGELIVTGTVDDTLYVAEVFPTSYSFVNILPNAGFSTSLSGPGGVSLTWSESVLDGDSTDARGQVDLPSAGLVAGNCETAELSGTLLMNDEGNGFRFVLRELKASPFCSGAARSGELRGCFRFAQR